MKLEKDQKLWWVDLRRHHDVAFEVTVEKVGRKWAELSNRHRIDVETWRADHNGCGSSPGRCYVSREAWETEKATYAAWSQLARDIREKRGVPAGVTVENILAARKLLGFE